MLPKVMDAVMDVYVFALRREIDNRTRSGDKEAFPSLETAVRVFGFVPRGSVMSGLMVDFLCYNIIEEHPSSGGFQNEEVSQVMLENEVLTREVVQRLRGWTKRGDDGVLGIEGQGGACKWHIHENQLSPGYVCDFITEWEEAREKMMEEMGEGMAVERYGVSYPIDGF